MKICHLLRSLCMGLKDFSVLFVVTYRSLVYLIHFFSSTPFLLSGFRKKKKGMQWQSFLSSVPVKTLKRYAELIICNSVFFLILKRVTVLLLKGTTCDKHKTIFRLRLCWLLVYVPYTLFVKYSFS